MSGALGVVLTTDVPLEGRAAVPVYVDDTLPIVGPSRAVQVVSSGPMAGGPPLAVQLAPAGTPALGPALPVYVISGSLGGAPSSLLTSLVAYWPLADLTDASGNGRALTNNNGVTFGVGKLGNAASFVGASSQYLSIADAPALRGGQDFTIDGWVKITTPATTQYVLSKANNTSGTGVEYGLFCQSSALTFRVGAGSSSFSVSIGSISADTWTYFAAWYDAANKVVWGQLNNLTPVSIALTGTPNATTNPLRLGTSGALSLFLTGSLDEVGFWDKQLSGIERATRYNAGSGLVYPFNGAQLWSQTDLPVFSGTFTYSSTIGP